MKRLVLTIVAIVMACAGAQAVEVEIDGIRYDVVTRAKEATVIAKTPKYTGNIVIPASIVVEGTECNVTTIGSEAFLGCSLSSVTIPFSVTTTGFRAFWACTNLKAVHITDLAAWCKIEFSTGYSNPLSQAHHLFLNGEEIKDLVIPSSVTAIGVRAFEGCSGLTSVSIHSSVCTIGGEAFLGCTGLTSVVIPSSVTAIGGGAFSGCTGLTSVNIPSSVTTIEMEAFKNCKGITSVIIPSSVTTIGSGAFYGCAGLSSVVIPSPVTTIGAWAFQNCTGLTSVTIPSSITTIEHHAFASCTELAEVYCHAENLPRTSSDVFDGSYIEHSTLHVPATAIEGYRAREPWNKFGTIVAIDGVEPSEQCAKPTIGYQNGRLTFKSETEGVQFVSEITDTDIKKNYTATVDLNVTYTISVYATKEGYSDSEVATATLCWIEVEPQKEGITEDEDAVSEVKAVPVMIQRDGHRLSVDGAPAGTMINVYDLSGRMIGQAKANEGVTKVDVPTAERVVVVTVGERSVKVIK